MITHIVCSLAGHRRSVSSARRIGGVWRSRCKRCGAEIVRVRPAKWRPMAKVDLLALRPELLGHLEQRYATAQPDAAEIQGLFFEREAEFRGKRGGAAAHGVVCATSWEYNSER